MATSAASESDPNNGNPPQETPTNPPDSPEAMDVDAGSLSDPGPGVRRLKEGHAVIDYDEGHSVFYNPVQVFNRDLSVLMCRVYERVQRVETKSTAYKGPPDDPEPTPSDASKAGGLPALATPAEAGESVLRGGVAERRLRVLEALAASGLRSVRYAKEIPGLSEIVINDLEETAVADQKRNLAANGLVEGDNDGLFMKPNLGDAIEVMMNARPGPGRVGFDIVDVDPYGSASPFLDSAVQAVRDGGLMAITCTDMAVLCGNHPETTYYKYGCYPAKTSSYHHEMGLRILLGAVATAAARHQRVITPWLTVSADFYCRIFLRVHTSASWTKLAASNMMYYWACVNCDSWVTQPMTRLTLKDGATAATPQTVTSHHPAHGPTAEPGCEHCGSRMKLGGPLWAKPIHNRRIAALALDELQAMEESGSPDDGGFALHVRKRIHGMLNVIGRELWEPFHYATPLLASHIRREETPPLVFRSALTNAGYLWSQTHTSAIGTKTNAPASFVWDIMRAWAQHKPKQGASEPQEHGKRILAKAASSNVDLTIVESADVRAKTVGYSAFPRNPGPDWGPKARATNKKRGADNLASGDVVSMQRAKRARNQGHRADKKKALRACGALVAGRECPQGDACKRSHDPAIVAPAAEAWQKQQAARLERKVELKAKAAGGEGGAGEN